MLGGLPDAPEAAGLIRGEATLSLIEDEVVGRRSVRGETGEVRSGGADRSSGAEQRPPAERAVCAVPVANGVLTHAEDDSPGVHPLEEDGARVAAVEQHGGELSAVSPVASGWVICRGLQAERSSAKRKLSAAPSTPNHTPKQIQRGNRPCRIDPLLDHTPIAVKTAREQQCFYCNVRSCWFMCKCCEAPLHIAVAAGGARNAWPCFARYHMPLNNKHNHAYNRAEQTAESWSVDPDVTAVRQADQQRRKQKPVNERVQIGVQKSPRTGPDASPSPQL